MDEIKRMELCNCVFVFYPETVGEDTGFSVLDSSASGDAAVAAVAAAVTANKHTQESVHTRFEYTLPQLQLQIKVHKRGKR